MKEWRDWCTIVYNWEGEWTTFCSNNYCTQLSLVLIAHNQSVQDSETWKCTVPVFVQFKYTEGKYLKRQTLHRCAVKKSGWDRSDINIRERQEMQSRNYRQGFFVRPPFTHPPAKIEQFSRLYNFFLFPHLKNVFFNQSMSALAVRMTNRSKVPEKGGRVGVKCWGLGVPTRCESFHFYHVTVRFSVMYLRYKWSRNISSMFVSMLKKKCYKPLKGNAK